MLNSNKIKNSYTLEKKYNDFITGIYSYIIIRPLSLLITPLCIKLKLSPNFLSIIGLVPLVLGIYSFIQTKFFFGALWINLWLIFDCLDGNVARVFNKKSLFGNYLDTTIGFLYHGTYYLSIGLGLFLKTNNVSFFIIGSLSTILNILRRCISLKYDNLVLKYSKKVVLNTRTISKITIIKSIPRWILDMQDFLIIIFIYFKVIEYWLIFYFIFNSISYVILLSFKYYSLIKIDSLQIKDLNNIRKMNK